MALSANLGVLRETFRVGAGYYWPGRQAKWCRSFLHDQRDAGEEWWAEALAVSTSAVQLGSNRISPPTGYPATPGSHFY